MAGGRAPIARGGLHTRGAPLCATPNRGDPFRVQLVSDRLKSHTRGAHLRDSFFQLRIVRHTRRSLTAGRAHPVPRPLDQSLTLPPGDFNDRPDRQTPGFFFGVESMASGDEARVVTCQPLQQSAELRHGVRYTTQLGNDDPVRSAGSDLLQRIAQPGPLERSLMVPLTNDRQEV
jgi:hypothetical protein